MTEVGVGVAGRRASLVTPPPATVMEIGLAVRNRAVQETDVLAHFA
jgi:hypothetical protein